MSGFAIKFSRIVCDHPDCTNIFEGAGNFKHVRRFAQLQHWSHAVRTKPAGIAPVYDFCPKHADEVSKRELTLLDLVGVRLKKCE